MKHSDTTPAFGACRPALLMLLLFGTGLILCAAAARAQVSGGMSDTKSSNTNLFLQGPDSTQLEYFPLHVGDIWEYRTLLGGKRASKIYSDSLFENGFRYFVGGFGWQTAPWSYLRIDSLLRVVYGVGPSCESQYPGVRPWEDIPDGYSIYHLDEPVGKTWFACSDELGVLSNRETVVQYAGNGREYFVGDWRDVKYFKLGFTQDADTHYVFTCVLARNLGVVFEEWELDNMELVGARINGKLYGTITLDIDSPPLVEDLLTIDEFYPNPASTEAHIGFRVSQPASVDMDIYDMRGVRVKSVERQTQSPGRYLTAFPVNDLVSGSYYCRIRATSGTAAVVQHVLLSIVN